MNVIPFFFFNYSLYEMFHYTLVQLCMGKKINKQSWRKFKVQSSAHLYSFNSACKVILQFTRSETLNCQLNINSSYKKLPVISGVSVIRLNCFFIFAFLGLYVLKAFF